MSILGTRLVFTVQGRAVPQGSLRPIKTKKGNVVTPQQPKVLMWRADIRAGINDAGIQPSGSAFHVDVVFSYRRPKTHLTSKGLLRTDAPRYHTQAPDVDKLLRAVLDALTGVVWHDDKQVAYVRGHKQWSERDEATITITALEEPNS